MAIEEQESGRNGRYRITQVGMVRGKEDSEQMQLLYE